MCLSEKRAVLTGRSNNVEGFQQVLESMRDTFDQDEIRTNFWATGHVGGHWKNLGRSFKDGEPLYSNFTLF
jgi:hypothetical protein